MNPKEVPVLPPSVVVPLPPVVAADVLHDEERPAAEHVVDEDADHLFAPGATQPRALSLLCVLVCL